MDRSPTLLSGQPARSILRGPCSAAASTTCVTLKGEHASRWYTGKLGQHAGQDVCPARACREAAGCLAPAPVGVRRRKPTRADGSRVSRKRQAAGRATYYKGEKEAARCPLCQESVTVFFTKSLGHGRMEPACECNISRSCCYNCLYDWAVLHALERGRVIPDAATSTYPTGPLRCVSCKQVATRLLRLSSQGTVTSDVKVPYEFPSAAVRGEMAMAAQREHDQSSSWLRLVRPMKPPADIAAQEADYRCIPFTPYTMPHFLDLTTSTPGGTTPRG